MKKLLFLLVAFTLVFSLSACGDDEVAALPADGEVTMDNIDDFLYRDDVQYIDLRNFDDKMASGYISGFEMIPFFDYMEAQGLVLRDGDWTFSADEVLSQSGIRGLFNSEKAIFLMCGSGTRAGYVKSALENLGYENVYNVGGIASYDGDNMVLGDDSYNLIVAPSGTLAAGTYFFQDPTTMYTATLTVNKDGGIASLLFDAVYCDTDSTPDDDDDTKDSDCNTKQSLGEAYDMGAFSDPYVANFWFTHANNLSDAIVANQGWSTSWTQDETFHIDAVAGVTVHVDGFEAAWLGVKALATPAS